MIQKIDRKKILQIGCGRWGTNHLRAWRSLPVELFVSDRCPEVYATRCAPLEIPPDHFATDYRALIEEVDALDVVTPADSHFPLAREALAAGKDIFVEKPLTLSSLEARVLADEAAQHGRLLQVGHVFRFDTASRWLQAAVEEGRFGQLRMLRCRFSGFKRPRADSGMLLADGIHFLDLARFVVGRSPDRVTAVLCDFLSRGTDDEGWVSLEFDRPEGKIWATVEFGCHVPGKIRQVLAVGSELSALCDLTEPQLKVKTFRNVFVSQAGQWDAAAGETQTMAFPQQEPLREELAAFLDALSSRDRPLADGDAGYDSLRLAEAAFLSARESRTVALSELSP